MRFLSLALLLSFLLSACDAADGLEQQSSHLVVEGWIEDGGFPVVILTQSLPVTTRYQHLRQLSDYIVNWARVTISDGEDSVVLTGKYDASYNPPYIYTTGRLRGVAGRHYTLTVTYNDLRATATTTIPAPPQLDSFRVDRVMGNDTLFRITACFRDNPAEKNYYQLFTRVGTDSRQYIASYLGSVDDEVIGSQTEVPVLRGHQLGFKDYSPYFSRHDTVAVKLSQVGAEAYGFWDQYTKAQSLSTNMFLSTSSQIPTNITGGKGYWFGYGSVEKVFVLADY